MKKKVNQNITQDLIDLKRYKEIIDEDFRIFALNPENNKRFIQLEKGWIASVSHNVFPKEQYFVHEDRKAIREELLKHLKNKNWQLAIKMKPTLIVPAVSRDPCHEDGLDL